MSTHARAIGERRLLPRQRKSVYTSAQLRSGVDAQRRQWLHVMAHMAVVVALLCLAAANLQLRWAWSELEDGVLWDDINGEVVAKDIAPGTPAASAGIRQGDVLSALNGAEVISK